MLYAVPIGSPQEVHSRSNLQQIQRELIELSEQSRSNVYTDTVVTNTFLKAVNHVIQAPSVSSASWPMAWPGGASVCVLPAARRFVEVELPIAREREQRAARAPGGLPDGGHFLVFRDR